MPIGDLAAPASHRRRRDLLLEQALRHLDAVEAERGHVEQQRPAAGRAYDRQAVELAQRLVAPALPFGVRARQVVGPLSSATRAPIWAKPLATSPL